MTLSNSIGRDPADVRAVSCMEGMAMSVFRFLRRRAMVGTTVLIGLMPATPGFGQGTGGAANDSIKIAFETYTLRNGLGVILSVDRTTPTVAVDLWYHVGSKNEARGKTGFAHLFEHMMFTGSGHAPY